MKSCFLLMPPYRTRSLRSDYELTRQRPPMFLKCTDTARRTLLAGAGMELTTLTQSESATVLQVRGWSCVVWGGGALGGGWGWGAGPTCKTDMELSALT